MNDTNETATTETTETTETATQNQVLKIKTVKKHGLTCTKCQSFKEVSGPWFYKLVHQHGGKIQLSQGYLCPECNRTLKAQIIEAGKKALSLTSVQA